MAQSASRNVALPNAYERQNVVASPVMSVLCYLLGAFLMPAGLFILLAIGGSPLLCFVLAVVIGLPAVWTIGRQQQSGKLRLLKSLAFGLGLGVNLVLPIDALLWQIVGTYWPVNQGVGVSWLLASFASMAVVMVGSSLVARYLPCKVDSAQ